MIRLTLAQMRRSLGRLIAAGLAIVLGTGFVTATLLAGDTMSHVTEESVTVQFADADLVLGGTITEADGVAVREIPGVSAVHLDQVVGVEVAGPSGSTYLGLATAAEHPALEAHPVTEGRVPGAGEIALQADVADRLGLELGDSARTIVWTWDEELDDGVEVVARRPVVGFVDSAGVFLAHQTGLVPAADLAEIYEFNNQGIAPSAPSALIAIDGTRPLVDVQDDVRAAVGSDISVRTKAEQAAVTVEDLTGSATALLAVALGFAAIALVVAALVIANTFQVLVAQRTHMLALLRCIGADRRQLRRSVLLEASLLGVTASVVGVVLGTALFQGLLALLRVWAPDVPVPGVMLPGTVAVLVPVAVGVVVTMLAALVPARAATRVAPLAALRPAAAPTTGRGAGRVRAVFTLLLVVGGAASLAFGVVISIRGDQMAGLALGVLGGAASLVGMVVGAVYWVPWLLRRVDGLTRRLTGPSGRLASANAVRNPRRTAATSAALLIGVTLVAMMSTGATTTRVAMDRELAREFPVDVVITSTWGAEAAALPAGLRGDVVASEGVRSVMGLRSTSAGLRRGSVDGGVLLGDESVLMGVDVDEAPAVLNDPDLVAHLRDGAVLVPSYLRHEVTDGELVTLRTADGAEVTLPAITTSMIGGDLLATADVVQQLDAGAPVTTLWVALTDVQDAPTVVPELSSLASSADEGLGVTGAAIERAFFQQVITTLLAVVVGLLAISVVIALVGVANTLALSVIERRRENATLRAVGMSTRQLRASLAVEGLLIAGAGGVVGVLLGVAYGWAGATTVLGSMTSVGLAVPWWELAAVMVVALGAGLLASVLPARGAVRASPVEALAVG